MRRWPCVVAIAAGLTLSGGTRQHARRGSSDCGSVLHPEASGPQVVPESTAPQSRRQGGDPGPGMVRSSRPRSDAGGCLRENRERRRGRIHNQPQRLAARAGRLPRPQKSASATSSADREPRLTAWSSAIALSGRARGAAILGIACDLRKAWSRSSWKLPARTAI